MPDVPSIPDRDTPEWEAWVDGPRPTVEEGRGIWLNARKARKALLGPPSSDSKPSRGAAQAGDVVSEARALMAERSTPAAVKATLLKLIHETQRGPAVGTPTAVAQVEALTNAELHALAHERGLALPWPGDPEPA